MNYGLASQHPPLTKKKNKDPYNFQNVQEKPPPTAHNDIFQSRATALRTGMGGGERLKTALISNKAAGFPPPKGKFDPLGQGGVGGKGPAPPLQKKNDTEEEQFKEMEKEVNKLVEQSADAKLAEKTAKALELAKEAANKERQIRRTREQNGMLEQINFELTFCVCVNLANQFQANGMYKEALNTYTLIVKNKNYPNSGRLRVNMGNIYYEEKNYPLAIKMYRMALDTIPSVNKDMRVKIIKNIGHAFIKLGEFQDAIDSFENIMESEPDFQTGFNLVLCYYAIGDYERMKRWFSKLLTIEVPGTEEMDEDNLLEQKDHADTQATKSDPLKEYLKKERDQAYKYISQVAKLMAPVIEKDTMTGYDWILETLKAADFPTIESEIEIAKAIYYIKRKEFDKSITVFKSFEKKDKVMMAIAANNISFLYFLEKDYENAEKYAVIANNHHRYNAKALVNKGNCFFIREEFEHAKEHYLEAIGVEANCIEAIFNLGLANKRMGIYDESLQAFEKLQTIIPRNPEVMFQLGNLFEVVESYKQAIKWYNILITRMQSDPGILLKIGQLYYKEGDEIQALHFHQESYRYYPSNIETISWLGIYYARSDLYEKAIHFFQRASQIQTNDPKWKLMVATCYRKMNSYQQALSLYQQINEEHPDIPECLRYLVMICKDLGLKYDNYSMQLKKIEKVQEGRQQYQDRNEFEHPGLMMEHQAESQMGKPNAQQFLGKEEEDDTALINRAPERKMIQKDEDWGDDNVELP